MTEIPGRASGGTEQVARRFRRAWEDGARPRIEDYLAGVAEPLWPQALERLLRVECDLRREAGEESSVEEYLARFPEHGEVVEAVLGTTAARESAGPDQTRQPGGSRESTGTGGATGTLPRELADHDEYENVRELGDGGMGVVYVAHNRLMGRDEVLKIMARHIVERPGTLERFAREIRAVAKLRHPNIVSAYTAFRCGGSLVFAMEYVEGLDLRKMVKARGPLPVAQSCNYVYQAALGLEHAHEEGMVHRDIKPGNLMLSHRRGRAIIKLLDFGLAKATTEENAIELRAAEASRSEEAKGYATRAGQMLGTPDFIAPEQIFDATQADIRADIYSLGCTLYYLLTGRPPFSQPTLREVLQAHMSLIPTPLNLVRPDVPVALAQVVAKMLAKNPADRFQQPADVAQALRPFFKQNDASFKAVDLGTEAPFHAGLRRQTTVESPASQPVEAEEPDFEVLPEAIPAAPVGGGTTAAKRPRAATGEPASKPPAASATPRPNGAAPEIRPSPIRRLQSPIALTALAASALGAIVIAAVVLVARSGSRTNANSQPPADAQAATTVPSERTSSVATSNAGSPAAPDLTPTGSSPAIEPATDANAPANPSAPNAKTTPQPPARTALGWVNQIGDMTVTVATARCIGKGNAKARECLEVTLKISNGGKQPIIYRTWSDPEISVELKDQYQNYYARVVERAQSVSIPPTHTIQDSLYFEPTPELTNLVLLLPIPGSDGAFRLGIAARFIDRSVALLPQSYLAGSVPEKAAAAPKPLDPVSDPGTRSAIRLEYRDGMATIKQRAMYMSTNDAAAFRKREPKLLIKSIAKKHKLTDDQVKAMVTP